MARMGVKYTQPSADVRDRLRDDYANDADPPEPVSTGMHGARTLVIHRRCVA